MLPWLKNTETLCYGFMKKFILGSTFKIMISNLKYTL